MTDKEKKGSITCVGLGMKLGAHLTPISSDHINKSDICFVAASDGFVELWVKELHSDVRSLQPYYSDNQSRLVTYKKMIDAMMKEVRAGFRVTGIFYGHPGVFAYVPHQLIHVANSEGFSTHMEPGISAEDCLIADLGIDPGKYGCQQFEASQLLFYKRVIDPSAYLFLWQIGVVGDRKYGTNLSGAKPRQLLVDLLFNYYPKNHQVILYEASTNALQNTRKETIALHELPVVELKDYTTLVIPPSKSMQKNFEILQELEHLTSENN